MTAQHEDYLRLRIRFASSLAERALNPDEALREFASFGRRFSQDRDGLPQTDADRAFHLMAMATDIVDYQLPFVAEDSRYEQLADQAHGLLEEAVQLDPACYDALRILDSGDEPSVATRHRWLAEREREVRERCMAARDEALDNKLVSTREQGARLALAPYLRWLYAMAECSLVDGRNRMAIDEGLRLLELDDTDPCDVRLTLFLAYAKLEDDEGLNALMERLQASEAPFRGDDAWIRLSRMSLARAQGDDEAARRELKLLVESYPSSVELLLRQPEVPDGEYARMSVQPYSTDELVIALSEASVLLEEGSSAARRGALGAWIAQQVSLGWPEEAQHAVLEMLGGGA